MTDSCIAHLASRNRSDVGIIPHPSAGDMKVRYGHQKDAKPWLPGNSGRSRGPSAGHPLLKTVPTWQMKRCRSPGVTGYRLWQRSRCRRTSAWFFLSLTWPRTDRSPRPGTHRTARGLSSEMQIVGIRCGFIHGGLIVRLSCQCPGCRVRRPGRLAGAHPSAGGTALPDPAASSVSAGNVRYPGYRGVRGRRVSRRGRGDPLRHQPPVPPVLSEQQRFGVRQRSALQLGERGATCFCSRRRRSQHPGGGPVWRCGSDDPGREAPGRQGVLTRIVDPDRREILHRFPGYRRTSCGAVSPGRAQGVVFFGLINGPGQATDPGPHR